MPRGEDAKRQSLLRLGDFDLYKKFVDILSLVKRNILLSPHRGEGIAPVISFALKSKNLTTHENNLPRKELSALVPQYLSNFPDTVFSRFTSHFSRKRTAFTLAEVLITLGIFRFIRIIRMKLVCLLIQMD